MGPWVSDTWKKQFTLELMVLSVPRNDLLSFFSPSNQATEEVSKNLVAMKEILYGTNEKEPQTEAVAQLAQELYNSGLLGTLVADLQLIDFEVRSSFTPSSLCGQPCGLRKQGRSPLYGPSPQGPWV